MKSHLSGISVNFLKWWRVPGSNRWPPACKAGALPAELTPHVVKTKATIYTFHASVKCLSVSLFLLSKSTPLRWALIWFFRFCVVGQGLAFLRKSHGGCNSPPDCCQVPPFESILACFAFWTQLSRPWLPSNLYLKWWAKMDSNHRPHDYQSCALASWAIGPYQLHFFFRYNFSCTL